MNKLSSILKVDQVLLRVKASSKKRVLESASLLFESKSGIARNKIFNSLFSREKLGSTGLGNGIAIPHGRIEGLKEAFSIVFYLEEPISFDANDEKLVDLLIFLLVPMNADQKHLEILSDVAEMLSNPKFIIDLKEL
jgi:PTS system nitrogen regulatory IIA component